MSEIDELLDLFRSVQQEPRAIVGDIDDNRTVLLSQDDLALIIAVLEAQKELEG